MPPSEVETAPPVLLLASQSPRRRALLSAAGVAHAARAPGVDDAELEPAPGVDPAWWVMGLAHLKARAGAAEGDAALVLGADTVCVRQGRVIGQPRDEREARGMIEGMAGGAHEVITGVALLEPASGRRVVFADRAQVRVGAIARDEIEAYVASGEWRGKAGGYNLMERVGAGWPIAWEGDETTIMGLPMRRLVPVLERALGAAAEGAGAGR